MIGPYLSEAYTVRPIVCSDVKKSMASTRRIYSPPSSNSGADFETWVHEVEIWQCATDLEVKKQGPAIYLALEGPVRQACSNIDVKELHDENRVKIIIEKLKSLYAKGANQAAFMAYENFENFTRPEGTSILDYINKFDQLYEVIRKYKMELPDGVLAHRLLKSTNISKEKQQLARAILTELAFANMRKQLKAIHDSASDHYHPI